MRRLISRIVLAGVFVAGSVGPAVAQAPRAGASAPRAAQPQSAQMFVADVAKANMAEIQWGHLAAERAQDDAVKDFAEQMVEAHIKAQNSLLNAAMGAGVPWPRALDAKHEAVKTRLASLNGSAFDREYMNALVAAHRELEGTLASRLARNGANGASGADDLNARVAGWTTGMLADVREHLKRAESLSPAAVSAGVPAR